MFRKNKLDREGLYEKDLRLPEYDLLFKIQKKWKGYHIPKPLYHYNRRKESLSGKKQRVKGAIAELEKPYPHKIKEIKKLGSFKRFNIIRSV
jgi:hypothetical protein